MGITRIDYHDADGIARRVLVPSNDGAVPEEGIPISVPIDVLYGHMPLAFRQKMTEELWSQGLIEPADFLTKTAGTRIRAALLSVVKHDVIDIQDFARRYVNDK